MDARTRGNAVDAVIAELAGRQHGIVSRRNLVEAGVSRDAIKHRLCHARLHVVYRGVYAAGHPELTPDGIRIAAVLAAGPGAVLSHRAAAAHWGLRHPTALDVTVERSRRQLRRIRIHTLPLPEDEITTERAVPVTTVPRTLFDLASVLSRPQVERAIHEAEVRRHTDSLSLPDLICRYPNRRGAAMIRAILEDGATITRSELEIRFLSFIRNAELPLPVMNVPLLVAGIWIECDCVWRDARVIVELDGRAVHDTAAAFERDRARDRMLQARGWRTVRVTWRQLRDEPEALAYDLRALLTASAGIAPSRRISHRPSSS